MSKHKGTCGECGAVLEQLAQKDEPGSVLLLCSGCGLIVGRGVKAAEAIAGYIAEGLAVRVPSVDGVHAMQLLRAGRPGKA